MKKCPTCDKTFDDNLKFCQSDGTPLVDDAPSADPYATMVGNQADFQIPPKEETKEPKPSVETVDSQGDDDGDVLEVPEAEEFDPMKTMVAGGDTSSNVKVDIPETELKDPTPPVAPEPPKFEEPEVFAPDMTGALSEKDSDSKEADGIDTPPPSPFDSETDADDKPSAPIPSPFDKSMPPGYAPPSTPPFDPSEPVKAEKVASTGEPVKEAKPFEESNPSGSVNDFAAPSGAVEEWKDDSAIENIAADVPTAQGEGQNMTLAYVSMGTGILSMLCCFSIITGPVAVVTGFMARGKINENPSEYGGGTFALVGMITGVIGILLFIALIILQIFSGALANLA